MKGVENSTPQKKGNPKVAFCIYLTIELVDNHIPTERILDLASLYGSDVVVELE